MELVSKKTLMLFAGRGNPELSRRSPSASTCRSAT